MMFPLFQFQLVADLFQDTNKDGSSSTSSSSKSSRINVRSAKPTPKVPNKEHRKTVGHQVSILSDTEAFGQEPVCVSVIVIFLTMSLTFH